MTFIVTGVSGDRKIISDCESASEAMEVYRELYYENVLSVEVFSLTSADEDMEDAFG